MKNTKSTAIKMMPILIAAKYSPTPSPKNLISEIEQRRSNYVLAVHLKQQGQISSGQPSIYSETWLAMRCLTAIDMSGGERNGSYY